MLNELELEESLHRLLLLNYCYSSLLIIMKARSSSSSSSHHQRHRNCWKTGLLCLWGIVVASNAWVLPVVDASGAAAAAAAASSNVWAQAWDACKSLDVRYFVAGGTCAALSHGITTPIDVIKTKIQAQPQRFESMSIPQAAVDIIKTDGPPALLGGLGPTVVGYGMEGAMKFGIYEVMKPVFAALLRNSATSSSGAVVAASDTQGLAFLLASVVAGAVAALFLCPMESTRIRMVTDPAYANLKFVGAWTKLIQDEGFASTFAGVWAMLSKQVRVWSMVLLWMNS